MCEFSQYLDTSRHFSDDRHPVLVVDALIEGGADVDTGFFFRYHPTIVAAYLGHSHVVDSLIEAARTSTRRTTTGPLRSTLLLMQTTPPSSVFSLQRAGLACEGHLGGRPSRVCAQEWAPGGCGDLSDMSTFFSVRHETGRNRGWRSEAPNFDEVSCRRNLWPCVIQPQCVHAPPTHILEDALPIL